MSKRLLGFLFLVFAALGGVAAAQTPSPPHEAQAFVAALETCRAAKAATPHPLMPAIVIEHVVTGEENGACRYSQTMPGKMKMVCGLSVEGRTLLASEMKALVGGGPLAGGTQMSTPQWFKECEIELPNGTRVPAASQGRGR